MTEKKAAASPPPSLELLAIQGMSRRIDEVEGALARVKALALSLAERLSEVERGPAPAVAPTHTPPQTGEHAAGWTVARVSHRADGLVDFTMRHEDGREEAFEAVSVGRGLLMAEWAAEQAEKRHAWRLANPEEATDGADR